MIYFTVACSIFRYHFFWAAAQENRHLKIKHATVKQIIIFFFLSNSKSMNVRKKQCLPRTQIPKNQFETHLLVAKKQTRQAKAHKYDQISTLYIPIICPITKENNFVIHKSIFFERGTFRSTNCWFFSSNKF